jgi:hypothetical protein
MVLKSILSILIYIYIYLLVHLSATYLLIRRLSDKALSFAQVA